MPLSLLDPLSLLVIHLKLPSHLLPSKGEFMKTRWNDMVEPQDVIGAVIQVLDKVLIVQSVVLSCGRPFAKMHWTRHPRIMLGPCASTMLGCVGSVVVR